MWLDCLLYSVMVISLFGVSSVIPTLVASKFLEKLAINGFVVANLECCTSMLIKLI